MDKNKLRMLNEINSAIIQFRGNYSAWCKAHGIGYNEMLVMYSIREKGYCTQKQICDQYLLPRQTINHVINALRAQGILREQASLAPGREKAFVLTERGESYMGPFLASMNAMESRAVLADAPGKAGGIDGPDGAIQSGAEKGHGRNEGNRRWTRRNATVLKNWETAFAAGPAGDAGAADSGAV